MANVLNTDKQIAIMPSQPKPTSRPVGRPKLPTGEAKGKLVALRLSEDDQKDVAAAARISGQSVSEWIRASVKTTLIQSLAASNEAEGARSPTSRSARQKLRKMGVKGGTRAE